jgi:hypothetical protein
MTLEPNTLAIEISDKLNATGNDYTTKTTDLNDYGTSYEITKHDSDKKLCITPVEGALIDMALYDGAGNTIATSTLYDKAVTDITIEDLTNLITIYL